MTDQERDALVEAFQRPPYSQVGSWTFEYDDGYFFYEHPSHGAVYFTPDTADPGAVRIDLIDGGGDSQGTGRIPFTSMRAEDLFAIVRPFLKGGAGRKEWDPRRPSLGAIDDLELAQELQSYMSRHDSFAGESYEFNIRVGAVNLPQTVRQNVAQNSIDDIVRMEMEFQLREFIAELKRTFPWIYGEAQAGRSGGWLVLQPDYGVMDEDGTIPNLAKAGSRLKDLQEISRLVQEGVRGLEEDLATLDFWSDRVSAPIQPSRKDWDPRDPQP